MTGDNQRRHIAELVWVRDARIGRLATIDDRGFPSVVPFCFAVLEIPEPTIVTVLDEKPKQVMDARLARVRNIARHPEVGIVVDHYEEDWSKLVFVQLKGVARLVEPSNVLHATALVALREKYPQYRRMALEQRTIIAIENLQTHSWRGDGSPFA